MWTFQISIFIYIQIWHKILIYFPFLNLTSFHLSCLTFFMHISIRHIQLWEVTFYILIKPPRWDRLNDKLIQFKCPSSAITTRHCLIHTDILLSLASLTHSNTILVHWCGGWIQWQVNIMILPLKYFYNVKIHVLLKNALFYSYFKTKFYIKYRALI